MLLGVLGTEFLTRRYPHLRRAILPKMISLEGQPIPMPGKVYGGSGYCRKPKPAPLASRQGQLGGTTSALELSIGMAKPLSKLHHSSTSAQFCFSHPSSCHPQKYSTVNLLTSNLRVCFLGPQSMVTPAPKVLL